MNPLLRELSNSARQVRAQQDLVELLSLWSNDIVKETGALLHEVREWKRHSQEVTIDERNQMLLKMMQKAVLLEMQVDTIASLSASSKKSIETLEKTSSAFHNVNYIPPNIEYMMAGQLEQTY